MRVFSGLDRIPSGNASSKLTSGCLVLEGGAFRGVYTQGVLDAFMEYDINMQCTIGVSAGALAGMNYTAGQIGRSARVNLGQRHNSAYVGAKALAHDHSIISLNYLLEGYNAIEPLNLQRFHDPNRRFVVVVTSCLTGNALYKEQSNCESMMSAIKASASMPFVSPMVDVDGIPCLDGGCSCKIPYQWALEQGYEKIVIIKTRERGFRKHESDLRPAKMIYRHHTQFAETLDDSAVMYNWQCDEVDELERSERAFVIAPSEPVDVSRVEGNMEKLGHLYLLGYYDALVTIPALWKYLEA